MKFQLFKTQILATLPIVVLSLGVCSVSGQTDPRPSLAPQQEPTLEASRTRAAFNLVREHELYCAGAIESQFSPDQPKVVGGELEQERYWYSTGNSVFINSGRQGGMAVGQEYMVVRPRGAFSSRLSVKKGSLGVYVEEIARVRITEVKDLVAVARVSHSCEVVLVGDYLQPLPLRVSPQQGGSSEINHFADTGAARGRIVLSRDSRENLSKDQVVFIDLGSEDGMKNGDVLTIVRSWKSDKVARYKDEGTGLEASHGFESFTYPGNIFSNQAQSVTRPNDKPGILNGAVNTPDIQKHRPAVPLAVVGRLVLINVQQRTATAVITQVVREVHPGDFVQ